MSGIVGIFNLDARPAQDALLTRMSAALRHRGPDGEGRRVSGPAGFAWQHLWVTAEETGEIQPLVGHSGAMLVMDGRLDNRDELLGALRLPPTVSDAACALAAYEEAGRLAGSEEEKEWALERKADCLDDMGRVDEARKLREDAGLPDPGDEVRDEGDESDEPWPEFGGNVLPSPEYRREADEPPPPLTAGPKVGRNEPCPCGSGKKYKKCCGK